MTFSDLTANEPAIQYVAAATNSLPTTMVFTETTTTQVLNADLLPIFQAAYAVATPTGSLLYFDSNENVDTWEGQMLFYAETNGATNDQLGRLRDILDNVAGLLRGDSNGILLSQWDANPQDSQEATYSDDIVSTQRSGQDQRYYITVPTDVQMGSFQLKLTIPGPPTDLLGVQPNYLPVSTVTTAVINMPSTNPNAPGGPIDALTTEDNIATAIDNVLGTLWPGLIPTSARSTCGS